MTGVRSKRQTATGTWCMSAPQSAPRHDPITLFRPRHHNTTVHQIISKIFDHCVLPLRRRLLFWAFLLQVRKILCGQCRLLTRSTRSRGRLGHRDVEESGERTTRDVRPPTDNGHAQTPTARLGLGSGAFGGQLVPFSPAGPLRRYTTTFILIRITNKSFNVFHGHIPG